MNCSDAHTPLIHDYHLLTYDVLDSTNDEARRIAEGGGSHGAVVWARRQTAGRGRMGRQWVSPEGNLFASILLQPELPLASLAQASFVTSVALVETIAPMLPAGSELACKWPNDVLLNARKLSGILLESFSFPEQQLPHPWLCIGLGVNVDSYPEHVMYPATSLREAGVELISAKIVLSRFMYNFFHYYDVWMNEGFSPVRKAWLERAYKPGEAVEVTSGDRVMSGLFSDIDDNGQLCLKHAGGIEKIAAGDVFFGAQ